MVDMPPRDNPDSRNFLTRRVEDYRLSEEIDGIIWACEGPMRFRTLPGARHDQPAIDPGNLTCFCQVCPSKAKERGIDVERGGDFRSWNHRCGSSPCGQS